MKTTLAACALALSLPLSLPAAFAGEADDRFRAIHEKEWAWRKAETGQADEDSDAGGGKRTLPDVGAAAQQRRLAVWDDVLKQLDAIDAAALSEENRVNLAVYRPQVENLAADVRFRAYEMPFNADSSFWANLAFMARRPMTNASEFDAYIARLDDVPRLFDQHVDNMRAGLARGFTVPRAVLDGRDASIAAVADLQDPTAAALYAPFKRMPAQIPAAERERLQASAQRAIRESVIPAYAKLLVFFRSEYVPKARTTLAAEAMPDGEAFYRQQIRDYTTLDYTPQQIHDIGLAEVARIEREMAGVMREAKFDGDLKAFIAFLRTDKQFYATTPQQLLDHAAWIAKRIDGEIGKVIGTLPRGRFTIVEVPADIAPYWTAGRGGRGTYWLNTYDLPSRPLYNLPALTLHEAEPGHALQGALSEESKGLPDFRRETYISAYGEGWGLYSEKLGVDMGIYRTPYEHFGRLTYEMWRAARLVIDTGLHSQGWTRDRALAYLRDRTALSEHEVTTEVDRYISWPGQALSYKLGEIVIVRLRGEAEQALGERFDLKAFNDAVLATGSVPLPVLETQVRAWIAAERAKPAA